MDWRIILIIGLAVAAVFLLKKMSFARPAEARALLEKGALVVDVRNPDEYREQHLPGAVNVPLGELRQEIGRVAPDKGQPLLLHCLSGGRSGMAKRTLQAMGYQNVHNLGGYSRAEQLVQGARR